MTTNMQYIVDSTTALVNRKYGDALPTLEQINAEAEIIRNAFSSVYPVSDDEFEQVKKTLATDILHTIGFAITLRGRDAEHQSWYYVQENDGYLGMNSDCFPDFLIHDSPIFDAVDERQVARALMLAKQKTDDLQFQYICMVNSDKVPYQEFDLEFEIEFSNSIVLRISDNHESGGLLGIRF